MVVIDVDPKNGGDESVKGIGVGLPITRIQRTGSGGQHFVFRVPDGWDITRIRNSAGIIAPGIDIRCGGGQIVAAPSVTALGEYIWENDEPVAELPKWLYDKLCGDSVQSNPVTAIPTTDAIHRARAYVNRMRPAVSGKGGHNDAFRVAVALVRGFALDRQSALTLFREYNKHCKPPWSEKELLHKIDDAVEKSTLEYGYILRREKQVETGKLPEIRITLDIETMIEEACDLLKHRLYHRNGELVEVVGSEIRPVHRDYLKAILSNACEWVTLAEPKDKDINLPEEMKVVVGGTWMKRVLHYPPNDLVAAMARRGNWPHLRRLDLIAQAPYLRSDGTVCQSPGYDDGVLYIPNATYSHIPDNPTREDAVKASEEIYDVVRDFPFKKHAYGRWLSGLLTVVARPAFDGPAPLFAVTATKAGTGKGYLCGIVSWIAAGMPPEIALAVGSQEEVAKNIASMARAGIRMASVDNVDRKFGGQVWNAILTSEIWRHRTLGEADGEPMPMRIVWWINGNNITFHEDVLRRAVLIELETEHDRPEHRTDFKYPDILGFVRDNRARLLTAALTILRAHHVSGHTLSTKPMGSYGRWANVVQSAVDWLGLWGDTSEEYVDASDERRAQLIQALITVPVKDRAAGVIVRRLDAYPAMKIWVESEFDGKPTTARRLSDAIYKYSKAWCGNCRIVKGFKSEHGQEWLIEDRSNQPVKS